ncbi:MAG: GFA family protein [Marinicaulis sp.]|nr:GFA family protein [Marinicaulis sp.]
MAVSIPIEGGCQCGALRYQLSAAPVGMYACHCTNCQKQTGSAFVLSAAIIEATFSFTEGEPSETNWTSDAGNKRYGKFCGSCGNRIVNGAKPSIGILSLRAGTIDDTSWIKPGGHIWTKSAQPWIKFSEDDLLFEGQPEDYGPLIQRFRELVEFEDTST